ncbi:MAG: ribosomal protein S18-alanine N-acetyltransferase [Clostridia bacterium]|nr:ribosomal protein S18-alanine N-acetyltransferase [Clostridia bacterium]
MGNNWNEIKFVPADESHIDQMHEIEKSSFSIPWSYDSLYQDVCEHEISVYIAGICNGEVVAYAGLWYVLEESHVTNIAVREDFRNRGVGGLMMEHMFSEAKRLGVRTMTLEVRESNAAAIRLYEKTGFYKVGIRKKYYPDTDENAIIMNRML